VPKVSVCIPSYNYAHYIAGCIQSVLEQTYRDYELVIVDNRSSDNTVEVVHSFRDPRIRFFQNERNLGLVPNWNRCVSLASGEYIAVLPADDAFLPRMLERSVAMLDAHPNLGFTYSSYYMTDELGKVVQTKRQWDQDRVMTGEDAVRTNLINANFAIPVTVLMRRDCYGATGGYDETYRLIVDWVLYMRAALRHDVGYIAELLAFHRYQQPSSVSAQTFLKKPRLITNEELRLIGEVLPRLQTDPEWKRFRRRVHRGIIERHVLRTQGLLIRDGMENFRSELAYAMALDPTFPFRYRKMMALWLASYLGPRVARRLDSAERKFWASFSGRPDER